MRWSDFKRFGGKPVNPSQGRLAAALVVSFCVHGVLLWPLTTGRPRSALIFPTAFTARSAPLLTLRLTTPQTHLLIAQPIAPQQKPELGLNAFRARLADTGPQLSADPDPVPPIDRRELAAMAAPELHPEPRIASLPALLPDPLVPTHYWPSAALSHRPRALTIPDLEPRSADSSPAGRDALRFPVKLYINARGGVDRVEIAAAADVPPLYRQAVEQGFGQLWFSPAERDGQAVAALLSIEVRYDEQLPP